MSAAVSATGLCPFHLHPDNSDERKSAAFAVDAKGAGGGIVVRDFAGAKAVLRDPSARQAGFLADLVGRVSVMRAPILYLHGAEHRRQRGATARFFAPRVVDTTYRTLMEQTADAEIARFLAAGRGDLDAMALTMAVTIAAEIVGLTDSDRAAMARRLDLLATGMAIRSTRIGTLVDFARAQARMLLFLWRDVKPAIRARRATRRADVISHLLDEGYGDTEILTECITYGAAGMVTTREFITMAGWHLLERGDLRARFLVGDETQRIAILEEILRLEPVVGTLQRRITAEQTAPVVTIDVRAANADPAATGACPHRLDPDRVMGERVGRAGLAFGDGEHRCPGAQVALQESAIFLDRLLRVPGLRLARTPDIGWNGLIAGYELRGATLTCEAAQ